MREMFVSDRSQFLKTLRRVHADGSYIMYPNADDTLRFMLRDMAQGGAGKYMTFELVMVLDDEDGRVAKALRYEHDEYADEDDAVGRVIGDLELGKGSPDEDELEELDEFQALVNKTRGYRICPCETYLIKDDADKCFACEMRAVAADLVEDTCPICLEQALMMHMKRTKCCGKLVHRGCSAAWAASGSSSAPTCPLCRGDSGEAPPTKRMRLDVVIEDSLVEGLVAAIEEASRNRGVASVTTAPPAPSEDVIPAPVEPAQTEPE